MNIQCSTTTVHPPHQPRRCRGRTLPALLILVLILLGISLVINWTAIGILTEKGAFNSVGIGKGKEEFPKFTETHAYGRGTNKVVHLAFSGLITRRMDSGLFSTIDPVQELIRQIRAARQDPYVKAILFDVNSPGGEVTAADEIHHELALFKASAPNRRLIVFVRGMAASGGYYISLPADHIIAQPTSIIGSIGVIMQSLNIQGLSEKIGVTDVTLKSGKHKDMLNPFHPADPEELGLLQATVDAIHSRFTTLVSQDRKIKKADLKQIADGRIFTAEEAKHHRLIDSIGYWEDALHTTCAKLDVEDIYVVQYNTDKTFFDVLFGARAPLPDLQNLAADALQPRLLYLWQP